MRGAEKAIRAGAAAIVVSNHGDVFLRNARQQRCCRKSKRSQDAQRFVDGAYVRSGHIQGDRPRRGQRSHCPPIRHGGFTAEGIGCVKICCAVCARGLEDAMTMCGAADIASISRDMIRI